MLPFLLWWSLFVPPPAPGVVVEEVRPGGAAARAGLMAGDVLLAWARAATPPANRETRQGTLGSPFDARAVELEEAPRGAVTLSALRGDVALDIVLPPGDWEALVRPQMPPEVLERYRQSRQAAGKPGDGLAPLEQAVAAARRLGDRGLLRWLLAASADMLALSHQWSSAAAAYGEALREGPPMPEQAGLHEALAQILVQANEPVQAEKAYQQAARLREGTLAAAEPLQKLGSMALDRGDLAAAEDWYRQALAIRERWAPDSPAVAKALTRLTLVANMRSDHDQADALSRRALAIHERLVPGTLEHAESLTSTGGVASRRGEWPDAQRYWERALEIRERLAPEGQRFTWALNNLALAFSERGEYAEAERLLRRSLKLKEALNPNASDVASVLNNLGFMAHRQQDLAAAESFYRRSAEIMARVVPDSPQHAIVLGNLAEIVAELGDHAQAEALSDRALAIRERTQPGGLELADDLRTRGRIAVGRGNYSEAERRVRRALEIDERHAPGSSAVADDYELLGDIARLRADLVDAQGHYEKSLAIRERLELETFATAATHYWMASIRRLRGDPEGAGRHFARALEALEAQGPRVGGGQERQARLRAHFVDYYRSAADLLIEQDRPADAFAVLERSRARVLLQLMAERDLDLETSGGGELDRQRRHTDADYERVRDELAALDAKDHAAIDGATLRLRELRQKQAAIAAEIRASSPRLAEIRYSQPLDAAGVRASLDAGTVLVAYSVGREKTIAFALVGGDAGGLEAVTIPIGEEALRSRLRRWRRLLERTAPPPEFFSEARALYDLLLRPLEAHLVPARRLLISPDGPLHTLPFAALRRGSAYLAAWKPTHVVQSGSVYARLLQSRGSLSRPATLLAFGDPRYAPGGPDSLPETRNEVHEIARLLPGAVVHLGDDASEENAKAAGRSARYIHFACHGTTNERFPLDSALLLSAPGGLAKGRENGTLYAWEIFERVRLDADLVTLSVCRSGAGAEIAGEGLIGLTRAFQYAGARSVLAALWGVGDETTVEFMARFYRLLQQGVPKDEALRRTQVAAIRAGRHPVRWAAFQLYGDWR
jgi:CHAT domain-containing protein/Tfp pilus assembly protein PilF